MSRKRDTNWSRDEITVLLDSIMEITQTRASDGKRTNSREVFEFAAKKMADKGHTSRAEREKCRTKWKKMKEEFTHAKRAREGDSRYKEAPGMQPFYSRMEEFINGNFDNISPHSTIVRRTSSLSSSRTTSSSSGGMRTSARIAANFGGTASTTTSSSPSNNNNDNTDTSSTIVTKINTCTELPPATIHTPSNNTSHVSTTASANSLSATSNTPIAVEDTCPTVMPSLHNQNTTPDQADTSYRVTYSSGYRQITIFGDHDVDIKLRGDCVTINKIHATET